MTQISNINHSYGNRTNNLGGPGMQPAMNKNVSGAGGTQSTQNISGSQNANGASGVQRNKVANNIPQFSAEQLLQHCDNGTKALLEHYNIKTIGTTMPDKAQKAENLRFNAEQLGLDTNTLDDMFAGKVDANSLANAQIKALMDKIMEVVESKVSNASDKDKFFAATKMLKCVLESDQCARNIKSELLLQGYRPNGSKDTSKLSQDSIQRIINGQMATFNRLADTIEQGNVLSAIADILVEQNNHDASSAKEILNISHSALASMENLARTQGFNDLADKIAARIKENHLEAQDGNSDKQMSALAELKRDLKKLQKEFTALHKTEAQNVKNGSPSALQTIVDKFMVITDEMQTQIKATAEHSLQKKIQEAQAEHVRAMHEQGGSQMFMAHIEAGPEFSVLEDRFAIGLKASFTYTFIVNVPVKNGPISITNSIEAGINLEGNFMTQTDPVSGSLKFKGHVNHSKTNIYSNPAEVGEAESSHILKRLMHYAKPASLPKNDTQGVKGGLKSALQRAGGFFKSIAYDVRGLFTPSSQNLARKAVRHNEKFVMEMRGLGVLGNFDTIKRDGINRKLQAMTITQLGGGADIEGSVKFTQAGPLNSVEGKLQGKKLHSTVTIHNSIIKKTAGNVAAMKDFVSSEYANDTGVPAKERQQFDDAMKGVSRKPLDIMRDIATLKGEFEFFCSETNKDDARKKGIHSGHSIDRQILMNNRNAPDRGVFFRSLVTRCLSLNVQLAQVGAGNAQLSPEELQLKNACKLMLEDLSAKLDTPQVALSKGNLIAMCDTQKIKNASSQWTMEFKTKFNPPNVSAEALTNKFTQLLFKNGKRETTDISVKLNINKPSKSNGFYKKHATGTLSFSISGDMLVQFGSQIVSNVLRELQEKGTAQQNSGKSKFKGGKVVLESIKDLAGNVINDIAGTAVQSAINSAISKQIVSIPGQNGETGVSLGDMLQFKAINKGTFTVSIALNGTDNKVRYGGMTITNSRTKTVMVNGGGPVAPGIKIKGQGMIMMSSTQNVISTLGSNSLAPLLSGLSSVSNHTKGIESYTLLHKKALGQLSAALKDDASNPTREMKAFMTSVKDKCDSVLTLLTQSPKKGIKVAKTLTMGLGKFYSALHNISDNGSAIINSPEEQALQNSFKQLAAELNVLDKKYPDKPTAQAAQDKTMNTLLNSQIPAEGLPGEHMVSLAMAMKTLDNFL